MGSNVKQNKGTQPYDIFVILITILSIINIAFYYFVKDEVILQVVINIDKIISVFFLIDFLNNLFKAESKKVYFFKDYGWADLLASLPFPQFKILRIFRLIKAYRLIKIVGAKQIVKDFIDNRAEGALYVIFFLIIVLLEFGSIGVLKSEMASTDANIKSAGDAMWYVYVTITTVGYGDRYPTTTPGRLYGAVIMLVGVGLFAVLTGFLANKFLPTEDEKNKDSVKPENFDKIRQEIKEIKELLKGNKQ
jgi:voltage-gated potassium channel